LNNNLTQLALILDRSGSMSSIAESTVEGTNKFLAEQQLTPYSEANLLFVEFDHEYNLVYKGPIQAAPFLTLAPKSASKSFHYFKPRGNTALLDAIGKTVNELGYELARMPEYQRPGKVVVMIVSDGAENKSREFSRDQIARMIQLQRDVYQWQFMYLGSNQDAITVAGAMNIPQNFASTYAPTRGGTMSAFVGMSANVSAYRATGQSRSMDFSAEQRSRMMDEKPKAPAENTVSEHEPVVSKP
jgi:hypothetical protein